MKLIVGLGNPGRGYANNRHNLGFICIGDFAKKHKIEFNKKQGKARVGSGKIGGLDVVVARPQTYMNSSGEAVSALVKRYKISLDDLVVIHDDMDLPVGKIRIRKGGSPAGHKGIKSIIAALGSPDFLRVRIGIGKPKGFEDSSEVMEDDVINYVLGDFTREEKKIIDEVIPRVGEAVLCLITEGLEKTMNKFNGKS